VPELPEVETMVRGIRPFVENRRIKQVRRCPTKCRPISLKPTFARFSKRLAGQTVTSVRRIGKRVVLDLSNATSVVIEPRMTGLVLLANPPSIEHLRLEWQFEGHREFNSIWFWDRRGLGTVRLYSADELARDLGPDKLGPDALDVTPAEWHERLRATGREIKVALLDQKLVAGIGNLYASEILHLARINPRRKADSLTKPQIERLAAACHAVLERAIEHEGSTLGDGTYRNALSESGTYQNQHRVYMREAEPCSTCGKGAIVRLVQAQRSTFYCPQCQH
jgi:formamidopyrimidine-DNA glycosylase